VGRTARYQSEGKALLLLCPSEEKGMMARWGEKSIEVKKIKIKNSKMGDLKQQMQNFAFREPEIKYLGQRVSLPSSHVQIFSADLTGIYLIYEINLPTKGQDHLRSISIPRRRVCS
jgi:superfamily II DNA/RNA helicase